MALLGTCPRAREMALVAEQSDPVSGRAEIVAVGRLSKVRGRPEAEVAFVISDPWQNKGIGTELMRLLIEVARGERLRTVSAMILPENTRMVRLCEKFGFRITRSTEENAMFAQLSLE